MDASQDAAAWQGEAKGWENDRQGRPAGGQSVRDPSGRRPQRTLSKEAQAKRSNSSDTVSTSLRCTSGTVSVPLRSE